MIINSSKVNLSEKDIEDWLLENPHEIKICYSEYNIEAWIGRQVKVPSGVIDLIGYINGPKNLWPVIVEIKNSEFTQASILQVCRYAADIQSALNNVSYEENNEWSDEVIKIVIAKGTPTSQIQFEADAVNVRLMSFYAQYSLKLEGEWSWNKEFRNQRSIEIDELAQKYFRPKKDLQKAEQNPCPG